MLVNPVVAMGQAHGAMAQGAGQALLEQAVYNPPSASSVTGSFMDYALPRANDLPSFELEFNPSRCTTNPLGVKGAGEAAVGGIFPGDRQCDPGCLGAPGGDHLRRTCHAAPGLAGHRDGIREAKH